MQSLSSRIYSLLSVLFFFTSVALRIAVPFFNLSLGLNIAFYACAGIGAVFIVLASIGIENTSKPFELNGNKLLGILSYIASLGFFVDFVSQAIAIYTSLNSSGFKLFSVLFPLCAGSAMSFASCFYFFTIGMSYGDSSYDFRKLKILHIAPILWAIANVLGIMTEAISPLKEVNSTLKYIAFIFAILYFYFFSKETFNNENAKRLTVSMAGLFSYVSILFFVDCAMLALTKNADVFDKNIVLGVTLLLVSLFALFHQRSIKKGA